DTQVRFDKGLYRPGEEATLHIGVRNATGESAQSAVGLKIVDRAVGERARTDSEFSGRGNRSWPWSLWSYSHSYAGVSRDDLDLIDATQPVSPDLELVAEDILSS